MREGSWPKQPGEVLTVQPDPCPEQWPCLVPPALPAASQGLGDTLGSDLHPQCLQFLAYPIGYSDISAMDLFP